MEQVVSDNKPVVYNGAGGFWQQACSQ
jgi:hypothetical protein